MKRKKTLSLICFLCFEEALLLLHFLCGVCVNNEKERIRFFVNAPEAANGER